GAGCRWARGTDRPGNRHAPAYPGRTARHPESGGPGAGEGSAAGRPQGRSRVDGRTRRIANRDAGRRDRRRPDAVAPDPGGGVSRVLKQFDAMLADLSMSPIDVGPRRFGRVTACDGGLLEVSGLTVPIGGLCRIDDGKGAM